MVQGCSVIAVMKNTLWCRNNGVIAETCKVTFPLVEPLSKEVLRQVLRIHIFGKGDLD